VQLKYIEGHDSVVLSAFGCGAFMNPPSHIAELFHDVIEENQYRHKFAYIGFAIIVSSFLFIHATDGVCTIG
jgi:uncharacterized protein (TIGR02452 family)